MRFAICHVVVVVDVDVVVVVVVVVVIIVFVVDVVVVVVVVVFRFVAHALQVCIIGLWFAVCGSVTVCGLRFDVVDVAF